MAQPSGQTPAPHNWHVGAVGWEPHGSSLTAWMLHVASVCTPSCICVLLGVIAQSFKTVKLLATPRLACLASVSNRVIARKLERKQKNGWRGRGRGEEVPSFPSPSPVIPFFFALVLDELATGQRVQKKTWRLVFMAGKELDSNFFIFLPQCFTNDPVSDIEKGSRNSCYAGEHLCFFLIVQFRGKNRSDAKFQAWQKRLLRLCSCVSVSSIDLLIRKDEAPTGGFITCWPISSFKMEGKETNHYKEKVI